MSAATTAVAAATDPKPAWAGPTTGPKAAAAKQIVYVAQTLTNPGVAGAAKGVQDAAKAIGWDARVIDGQGDAAGIQAAFGQALALKPAGIVVGGFDPNSIKAEITQANAANIPIIGWHALSDPGPSTDPKLFSNVTTPVADVAKISAQWIIAKSNGAAGVVVFTDNSIPFAAGKATMLETALKTCSTVKVLQIENIPIPDAGTRTPQEFSSLVSKLGADWTYSVAINDLYFDNAGTPLRAAGKDGAGADYRPPNASLMTCSTLKVVANRGAFKLWNESSSRTVLIGASATSSGRCTRGARFGDQRASPIRACSL